MPKKLLETFDIEDLVIDHDFQVREDGVNEESVERMMEALKKKAGSLPRIQVHRVAGFGDIVTDGHQRVEAHTRLNMKKISAEVVVSTMLDAVVAAMSANQENLGRPVTNKDKQRAIEVLSARLIEYKQNWSNAKIAETLGVDKNTVAKYRQVVNSPPEDAIPLDDPPKPQRREGRDGKQYPAPKPRPEPKPKPKHSDAQTWEQVPTREFLDIDGFVQDALDRSRITQAGDLYKRIVAGELFGLPKGEVADMRKACENLRDTFEAIPPDPKPVEKKQGAEAGFNLREFDSHYGYVTRGLDAIAALHPGEQNSMELRDCHARLREFREMFDRWAKRLKLGEK